MMRGQATVSTETFHRLVKVRSDKILTVAIVGFMVWSVMAPTFAPGLSVLSLGPVTLYPQDLLVIIAGLAMLPRVFRQLRMTPGGLPRAVVIAICLYVCYEVLVLLPVILLTADRSLVSTLRVLSPRFLVVFPVYFYLRGLPETGSMFVIRTMNIAAVTLALFTIGKFLVSGPITYEAGGVDRLREVFGGAALFFGWLILSRAFLYRTNVATLALIILGGVGTVLVNYRMAYLGLAIALAVTFALNYRTRRRIPLLVGLAGLVVLLVIVGPGQVRESATYSLTRILDPSTPTAIARTDDYKRSLKYIRAYPLGDYALSGRYYLDQDIRPGAKFDPGPHNFVLMILSHEGAHVMAFYAFILTAALLIALRNRRDSISAVMGSYLVFYLVFCSFTAHFSLEGNSALLGITMGIILHRNAVLAKRRAVGLVTPFHTIATGASSSG